MSNSKYTVYHGNDTDTVEAQSSQEAKRIVCRKYGISPSDKWCGIAAMKAEKVSQSDMAERVLLTESILELYDQYRDRPYEWLKSAYDELTAGSEWDKADKEVKDLMEAFFRLCFSRECRKVSGQQLKQWYRVYRTEGME